MVVERPWEILFLKPMKTGFQRQFVFFLAYHLLENNSKLGGRTKDKDSLPNNKKKEGNTNQDH